MSRLTYLFHPIIRALMMFSPLRALECLHFSITKNMNTLQWKRYVSILNSLCYTWCNDLRLYDCTILAIMIIKIFIDLGIVVTWDPSILICYLSVWFLPSVLRRIQMTLLDGKLKSLGLKQQQCFRNEFYCHSGQKMAMAKIEIVIKNKYIHS